jgi:putative oxidoreductase
VAEVSRRLDMLRLNPVPLVSRSVIWIRLAVGVIFATQGLLKYLDPHLGVDRFTRIGFPLPGFTAHLVGTFEIACGVLVLLGLWTRLAAVSTS